MTNRCFSYLLTDFFLRTTFQAVKPEDTVSHNNLKQNYTLTPRGREGERERQRDGETESQRDIETEIPRYSETETETERKRVSDRKREGE